MLLNLCYKCIIQTSLQHISLNYKASLVLNIIMTEIDAQQLIDTSKLLTKYIIVMYIHCISYNSIYTVNLLLHPRQTSIVTVLVSVMPGLWGTNTYRMSLLSNAREHTAHRINNGSTRTHSCDISRKISLCQPASIYIHCVSAWLWVNTGTHRDARLKPNYGKYRELLINMQHASGGLWMTGATYTNCVASSTSAVGGERVIFEIRRFNMSPW